MIERNDPDMLRSMMQQFLNVLMGAEASALCNAGFGEVTDERVNSRNGYRVRPFDTRLGTMDLSIPKLRSGTYYPDWLLETRKRSEQALRCVVAQCYVEGVSTRRVDDIVKALGIEGISKSQVSLIAQELDVIVEQFRNRPLDSGPYAYVWIDALYIKVREGGRVVGVATLIATAVTADGRREIIGVDVITTEDGAGWTAFLRGLVARGLSGVQPVISDAHEGLENAIAAVLPGASWQRCRTHFMRNLLAKVPKAAQGMVAGLVRTIFEQPDKDKRAHPIRPRVAKAARTIPRRCSIAQRRRGRDPGFQRVSERSLEADLVQQSTGTTEQGSEKKDRRRRHLPQSCGTHQARRSTPQRTK